MGTEGQQAFWKFALVGCSPWGEAEGSNVSLQRSARLLRACVHRLRAWGGPTLSDEQSRRALGIIVFEALELERTTEGSETGSAGREVEWTSDTGIFNPGAQRRKLLGSLGEVGFGAAGVAYL